VIHTESRSCAIQEEVPCRTCNLQNSVDIFFKTDGRNGNLARFLQCAQSAESCCKERFGMCKTATKGIRTKVVPLSVEGLFNKLEENQRLLESLEAESPAKTRGWRFKSIGQKGNQTICG
jgi:hypothetical protein